MIGCRSTGTESSSLSGPTSHLAGSLVACQLQVRTRLDELSLFPLQIKPLSIRPVKVSEGETLQELSRPHRSNSKEQLSEVSSLAETFHLFIDPLQSQVIWFHRQSRGTP
ncbi:hypothetical protein D4764_05G0008590 [Takifugu flavidus]|uniref:Uncharacterized protein n=1 Tax=Takifugu flavidus TaxID=433684 RepID=A0A5C6N1B5_9TELE|nr:hypothetical protein D4764_05G0008590 [Takifugu flavidus]